MQLPVHTDSYALEARRAEECPHRRNKTCGRVCQDLGFPHNMPLENCDKCFAAGPDTRGGEEVRAAFVSGVVAKLSTPDTMRLLSPLLVSKITARMTQEDRRKAKLYLAPIKRCGCDEDEESPYKHFFGRVVCINLLRRPERWARFQASLPKCWPFRPIERFRATDGKLVSAPLGWRGGDGTWGCRMSHIRALEAQASEEFNGVPWLILEDDAHFNEDFGVRVAEFLKHLPSDWEGIMLGGQHNKWTRPPNVNSHVVRVQNAGRTHAYAVRGRGLQLFLSALLSWKPGDADEHADFVMASLHSQSVWYAPSKWLVAQNENTSDINGRKHPRKTWNLPEASTPIVYIGTKASAVPGHPGYSLDPKTGVDKGLLDIFVNSIRPQREQADLLRRWVKLVDWEAAAIDTHPTLYTGGLFEIPDNLLAMVAGRRLRKQESA